MLNNKHSKRNRTITLSKAETDSYLSRCITLNENAAPGDLSDKIVYGDAFNVLPFYPSNTVDLLIVDPPYNLNKTYGNTNFRKMCEDDYYDFTQKWVAAAKRLLKSTASVYVCCDWRSSLIIGQVLKEHFCIQNRITWQREKGRGAAHNWKNSMEDIWFATVSPKNFTFNLDSVKIRRRVMAPYKIDGKPKGWSETQNGNFRDTCPSNFWDDISIPYWSMPENTAHPAQKPEKLMAKLILAGSNPGDTVFDPFLGSGTTAVTAKKLGRRFMGIESDRDYCALIQKRLEIADSDKTIQGYRDGVFWERNTSSVQLRFGG